MPAKKPKTEEPTTRAQKDVAWKLPANMLPESTASLAVLMDIRDELKELNALLSQGSKLTPQEQPASQP